MPSRPRLFDPIAIGALTLLSEIEHDGRLRRLLPLLPAALLERRLDNVVYKLGFTQTRRESRQVVRHGHFHVNGRKVNIPSFLVKAGDVVELREKSRKIPSVNEALDAVVRKGIPPWLELDRGNFRGAVRAIPGRADIQEPIQEQLIVELYSK